MNLLRLSLQQLVPQYHPGYDFYMGDVISLVAPPFSVMLSSYLTSRGTLLYTTGEDCSITLKAA